MKKSLPPLNWLRTFEAAARTLSFTRAAEELSLTQAAVPDARTHGADLPWWIREMGEARWESASALNQRVSARIDAKRTGLVGT